METGIILDDILSIEECSIDNLYDLTVEDNSNYYLDCGKPTLVHNSSKTWDTFQLLIVILSSFSSGANKKSIHVDVYRKTMVLARDNSFKDCLDCFENLGLIKKGVGHEKNFDYEAVGDSGNAAPTIRIWGHTIDFKGMPIPSLSGKIETGQADIVYINEIVENDDKRVMVKIMQRCYMLFLADGNPSLTTHWAYGMKMFNLFETKTTYLDNVHLPAVKRGEYESWCPWDFADSVVDTIDDFGVGKGFKRRRWLKPELPESMTYEQDVDGLYRKPNKLNVLRGDADRTQWLVYGEGEKCGQSGAIFKEVSWVSEFPQSLDNVHFGLDFGFSNDPSCLTRCGNIGMDMYIEKLCYQKTPTSDLLFDLVEKQLLNEEKRRYIEANGEQWYDRLLALRSKRLQIISKLYANDEMRGNAIDSIDDSLSNHIEDAVHIEPIIIVTDTADVYRSGTGGEQQFVYDLNIRANQYGYNWQFIKVGAKPIVPRISLMKKFKLFLIEDKDFRDEQQNYVYITDSEGNPTNIPDKASKFNHIWDSAGYCIWKMFKWIFAN